MCSSGGTIESLCLTIQINKLNCICKYSTRITQKTHFLLVIETSHLMLYRELMAICSEIHTKHISTLSGQNTQLLNVKLAVHIATNGLQRVKSLLQKLVR